MEVEAKFKLRCEPGFVIEKLVGKGFSELGFYLETDFFFKHPCRDFQLSDEALRIRCRRNVHNGLTTYSLCYKGPRVSYGLVKAREEYEVQVESLNNTLIILRKLGFTDFASFTKIRRELVYRNVKVCLDELLNVGFFIEFEGREVGEIEPLFNELKDCLEPVSKTYLEICIETGRCVVKLE